MNVKYTIEVNEEQCRRFLEDMDRTDDFESGFFHHRFKEEQFEALFLLNGHEWHSEIQFAVVDNRIIGYVFLNKNFEEMWKEEAPKEYPQICVWDVYVLPDFRGKGIGVGLLKASLEEQREEFESDFGSFSEIRIGADPLNDRAERFFNHLGFERLFNEEESGEVVCVTRIGDLKL